MPPSVILHQLGVREDVWIVRLRLRLRLNVRTAPSALHAGVSEGVPGTTKAWAEKV